MIDDAIHWDIRQVPVDGLGTARIEISGIDPGSVRIGEVGLRIKWIGSEQHLSPSGWSDSRTLIMPVDQRIEDDRLILVLGPDVLNAIDEATPVSIEVTGLDIEPHQLAWPALQALAEPTESRRTEGEARSRSSGRVSMASRTSPPREDVAVHEPAAAEPVGDESEGTEEGHDAREEPAQPAPSDTADTGAMVPERDVEAPLRADRADTTARGGERPTEREHWKKLLSLLMMPALLVSALLNLALVLFDPLSAPPPPVAGNPIAQHLDTGLRLTKAGDPVCSYAEYASATRAAKRFAASRPQVSCIQAWARAGDVPALVTLGTLHFVGKGVELNRDISETLWRIAAAQGSPTAVRNLLAVRKNGEVDDSTDELEALLRRIDR